MTGNNLYIVTRFAGIIIDLIVPVITVDIYFYIKEDKDRY
jgi:hypothetical protein